MYVSGTSHEIQAFFEEIKKLAFEIDKNIRMKYGTEAEFCRVKGRTPQSTNKTLNNLKKGKGANIVSVFEILNDLDKKLIIVDK